MKSANFWRNVCFPPSNQQNSCASCAAGNLKNFPSKNFKSHRKKMKYANSTEEITCEAAKDAPLKFYLFPAFTVGTGKILIVCLAILCYANSLDGQFVFDDAEAVVRNPDVRWSDGSILELFKHDFWGYPIRSNTSHKSYRPFTVLTFRLNNWWAGFDPRSYHAANIVLHAVVSVLCYEFFRTAARTFEKSERTAFVSAVLFSCHPVHTECVANVVGRAELLSAIWFLVAFFLYKKSCENYSKTLDKCFCMAVASTFLSLLSKEQGLTILAVCAIYDILQNLDNSSVQILRDFWSKAISDWKNNNEISTNDLGALKCKILPLITRLSAITLSGISMVLIRLWVVDFQPPQFTPADNPASFHSSILFRILNYNYLYALNLWLLINPSNLCFDYSMGCIPLINSWWDPRILLVLGFWCGVLAVVCCLVLVQKSSQRSILFSFACLVIPFLPASNLVFRVGFVLAERVLYLPSIGYCMLLGAAFESAQLFTVGRKRTPISPRNLETIGIFLILLFSAKSAQRSREWRSEAALFKSGAEVCPNNAKVHYNLGKILSDSGNFQQAEQKYRDALRLHPNYEQAMNNLANMLKDQQKFLEAESLLLAAVKIRPDFSAAWMNLGIVQAALKKFSQSEESYLTALAYRRHYPDCYFNLGNLYLEQGRGYEALTSWINATQQKPTHARAWINQLVFLDSQDDCARAVGVGSAALSYLPNEPALHFSIGSCLGKLGQLDLAEKHFLTAVKLDPTNGNYFANLGVLYHRADRYEEAEAMYLRALRTDPSLSQVDGNLKMLQRKRAKIHK